MKKIAMIIGISALSISLVGCDSMNKQDVGVITGGVVGGLVGSRFGGGSGQVLATIGGAIAGAAIGGMIGHSMDKTDQLQTQQALNNNKTDQTTTWTNPDTGNKYSVKPVKTYYKKSGTPCREYYTTAIIGGKKQQIYGTACRQKDGSWKVVQ